MVLVTETLRSLGSGTETEPGVDFFVTHVLVHFIQALKRCVYVAQKTRAGRKGCVERNYNQHPHTRSRGFQYTSTPVNLLARAYALKHVTHMHTCARCCVDVPHPCCSIKKSFSIACKRREPRPTLQSLKSLKPARATKSPARRDSS